jgi:acyl-CoA synthetase (AMP-forming)/AMP-acid ligase II
MPQFDAGEWLALADSEHVTHAFVVPTMLRWLLDHPQFAATDLSRLQVLSYGAAPMPISVIRRALEVFPRSVQFINAFGQTETTSTVTMLGPDDHRLEGTPEEIERKVRRLASIGRALPDVDLRILGEQGEVVSPGQVGEIAIRSDRTMRGYYHEAGATDVAMRDGWLHTRDLGWMDEDGYVFLVGRRSEMIIRGGENIAPEEVELVLESHPGVREAAVIGTPDDEWGERVAAIVAPMAEGSLTPSELIEYCRERLASFKKPEIVVFTDALPRNGLGKVVRSELRRLYAASVSGGHDGE